MKLVTKLGLAAGAAVLAAGSGAVGYALGMRAASKKEEAFAKEVAEKLEDIVEKVETEIATEEVAVEVETKPATEEVAVEVETKPATEEAVVEVETKPAIEEKKEEKKESN